MNNNKNNKSNKNGIALVGLTSLGIGLSSFFASKYMMNYAINRKQPSPLTKVRKPHHKPTLKRKFYTEMAVKSKELQELPHKIISIKSSDGIMLTGHYFVKENAKRTILAMHGWRSNWNRDFAFVGKFLINSDSNVLFIEQRGQNTSEGDYISMGLNERYDCIDWVNYLTSQNNDLPIYLYGISMGATSVLMATGLDMPDNVVGIIADCGFTSPNDISSFIIHHRMHMFYGINKIWLSAMFKNRTNHKISEYSTLDAMKSCKTPILFIHGQDDNFVPASMTYKNYNMCNCEKELLIVPKAEHAMSYFVQPKKYQSYLIKFWQKHDNTKA